MRRPESHRNLSAVAASLSWNSLRQELDAVEMLTAGGRIGGGRQGVGRGDSAAEIHPARACHALFAKLTLSMSMASASQ